MDNSDIIEPVFKNEQGKVYSTSLLEQSQKLLAQNYQMKTNMQEGTDYMLVDHNIYELWL
jgi:hypothetical protein